MRVEELLVDGRTSTGLAIEYLAPAATVALRLLLAGLLLAGCFLTRGLLDCLPSGLLSRLCLAFCGPLFDRFLAGCRLFEDFLTSLFPRLVGA